MLKRHNVALWMCPGQSREGRRYLQRPDPLTPDPFATVPDPSRDDLARIRTHFHALIDTLAPDDLVAHWRFTYLAVMPGAARGARPPPVLDC